MLRRKRDDLRFPPSDPPDPTVHTYYLSPEELVSYQKGASFMEKPSNVVNNGSSSTMTQAWQAFQSLWTQIHPPNAFVQYQQDAQRTLNGTAREHWANYALGLAGETGEVVDALKKVLYHGHTLDRDHVTEELGDVLFYVAALATMLETSLADIAEANIAKLQKRYPEGWDPVRSQQREEG